MGLGVKQNHFDFPLFTWRLKSCVSGRGSDLLPFHYFNFFFCNLLFSALERWKSHNRGGMNGISSVWLTLQRAVKIELLNWRVQIWECGNSDTLFTKDTKMVLGGGSSSWWKLAFLLPRAARAGHSAVVPWLYCVHTVKTQGKSLKLKKKIILASFNFFVNSFQSLNSKPKQISVMMVFVFSVIS